MTATAPLAVGAPHVRTADDIVEHLIAASPVVLVEGLLQDGLRLTYVSPNVQWILGFHPSEMLGDPSHWLARVHPHDLERCEAALRDAIAGEVLQLELEFRICNEAGATRWITSVLCLEHDRSVPAARAFGYLLDITHVRAAEAELREQTARADQANRAKSEFLSRVSHELRTPMNAVLGYAQLLQLSELRPDDQDCVEKILFAGGHLLDLIDDVLDISRVEAGQLQLVMGEVNISQVLAEAVAMVSPLAEPQGVELTVSVGAVPRVRADRQRLLQVVLNLLSNAVKYNRPGGSVRVASRLVDGRVRVDVSDTGPGIDPADVERLFVPFDRLGAEQVGIGGTGLGLPLSRRLVEAMGGRLDVVADGGFGATFWFELDAVTDAPLSGLDDPSTGRAGRSTVGLFGGGDPEE